MTLIKGSKGSELRPAFFGELIKRFQQCHDEIWEGGKKDPAIAFDEFSKLLMAKNEIEKIKVEINIEHITSRYTCDFFATLQNAGEHRRRP